ncbi:MAG: DNA internalization-related competence protein ComEC/Rec2 [Bacteroidota bacterium]|nr:DNA internalization-related competence protein ComEC/Rec2 [Bacteroidota bacterium]
MTKNKPALFAAFAIITGIMCAKYFPVSWMVWGVSAVVISAAIAVEYYRKRNPSTTEPHLSILVTILLAFSAATSFTADQQLRSIGHIKNYLDTSDSLTIVCKISDQPKMKEGRTKALVEVLSISNEYDSVAVEGKAYLTVTRNRRINESLKVLQYGSIVTCKSLMVSPIESRNPGEFNYKQYLELNNIYATINVYGYSNVIVSKERQTNFFFEKIIFPSKDFITETITTVMKGDEANFLIGLLLGDRTDISEEIKNAFMNTGTIHVLAVSGSHVVLVVAIIFTVFGLLRFPRRVKILCTILAIIYYTYLTGATPSVVRASLMTCVVLLGKFFEERVNVYNALGVSAIILLLIDPKQLFDVGFQLSFSAVFSIVYFYPKLNALIPKIPERLEELKLLKWVWQAFAVSLAAQIGTIPFTAFYFGKVSLVSFFANLIVVPLVGIIVTIGLSGALLGVVSLFAASCFSEVNNVLAWFTLAAVRMAEQAPFATVNTALFGLKETIFYSAVIGFIFNFSNRNIQKRILFATIGAAIIFLFVSIFNQQDNHLRVTFLDVGQGDAAVVQFPTGETIVVDGGPITAGFNAGEKNIIPFLIRSGIPKIDAIITTHPDADHLGGVPYLLKHYTVDEVIDQTQKANSKLFFEYDSLKQIKRTSTVMVGTEALKIPNARLYVLHPTKQFIDTDSTDGYHDLNDASIVIKLVYGKTSFLFTGDAEIPAEEQMTRVYGEFLQSDVIKAGHHGSMSSSSEEFISAIKPTDVVISVGKFNKFKHPSKIVLERYKKLNTAIHRTDMEGAIVFESDGTTITKKKWRGE